MLKIRRDAGGTILQLAAIWEQHCEGIAPALYSQVRYNSNVRLIGVKVP